MANQFRRPLKRRTATERLRLPQPTALQAAGGLTAVLLTAAMLWMALVSWPAPSPVVRMALSAGDPVTTASADVAAVSDGHDREGDEGASDAPPPNAVEPPVDAVSLDDLPTSPDDADGEARLRPAGDDQRRPSVDGGGAGQDRRRKRPLWGLAASPRMAANRGRSMRGRSTSKRLPAPRQKVAIMLGGMGLNGALTERAIEDLPGEVSLAFAPYPDGLQRLVNRAPSRWPRGLFAAADGAARLPGRAPVRIHCSQICRRRKPSTIWRGSWAGSRAMPGS